jgi:hypothetical protein
MTSTRWRALLAISAMATTMLTGTDPSGAASATLTCGADDSVLQGMVNGTEVPSQTIIDTIGARADPPVPPPVTFESGLSMRIEPTVLPPGAQDIDFFASLSSDLLDGDVATDAGVTEIELSEIEFEVSAADGVTGDPVVADVPDVVVDLTAPPSDNEAGPFSGAFEVTGPIGSLATFELTHAQIGIAFVFPGPPLLDVQFGISCEQTSADPIISAFILPSDADGPVVPALATETDFETPVDVDLLEGIGEGPVAATDESTVGIVGDPSNGSVSLDDGIAAYTPDDGFEGEDQFAYQVCTVPFTAVEGVNEIDSLEIDAQAGTYTLTVDGETTAPIAFDADASTVQAALEALPSVGVGNVVVTGDPSGFTIELTGALAATAVDLSADGAGLTGTATVTEEQAAVAAEIRSACGANVVTVIVGAEPDAGNPDPVCMCAVPDPADPQPVPSTFTG